VNLLDVARGDLPFLLSDFSVAASIFSPEGEETQVQGLHRDTGEMLDPETGEMVSGRHVSLVIPLPSVAIPHGVSERSKKPWKVVFEGKIFRIVQTRPDATIGALVVMLEEYR